MTAKAEVHPVKVSASFEASLQEAKNFLITAGQPLAFDALVDELLTRVVPNLGRFPAIGRVDEIGPCQGGAAGLCLSPAAGSLRISSRSWAIGSRPL